MGRMTKLSLSGMIAALLLMTVASAAGLLKPERQLNGITLGSSYADVLAKRGMPLGVGPAVNSVDEIWNLLDPPPIEVAEELRSVAAPGVPSTGASRMALYAEMKERAYQLRPEYVIWEYVQRNAQGKIDPKAAWATYVIFDGKGKVIGVVVMADHAGATVPAEIRTKSDIRIGSLLFDVTRTYSWPDPLIQYGNYFFCNYPDQDVAFTVNADTRRVTAIAIGLPVTANLLNNSRSSVENPTPTTLPGMNLPANMAPWMKGAVPAK